MWKIYAYKRKNTVTRWNKTKKKQNVRGLNTKIWEEIQRKERYRDESVEVETVGEKKEVSNKKGKEWKNKISRMK